MKRREFISILGGTAAWSFAATARSQQAPKVYRLAILTREGMGTDSTGIAGLRHWPVWWAELQRLGYVEGRNLFVERRSVGADPQKVRELVLEILALKPNVIFAPAQNIVAALRHAAAPIPIVAISADPVGSGFASSLARPGGNITGFSVDAGMETVAKRFALLKEAAPAISRIAWLAPQPMLSRFEGSFRDAATAVGITLVGAPMASPANEREHRRAFAQLVRDRADALAVAASYESLLHRQLIVTLAAEAGLPGVYWYREYAEAGGLMAYAIDLVDIFRRAAGYVDRIFQGANPAEMPFQQPARFDLIVNLKTAKALGLAIPAGLLERADDVIE